MSKTQLQTNNAKLESLITELQGKAAGGSGGGNVETCMVTVSGAYKVFYTTYADGAYGYGIGTTTLNNVVCDTAIVIEWGNISGASPSVTTNRDIELLEQEPIYGGTGYTIIARATSTSGGSITITANDGGFGGG